MHRSIRITALGDSLTAGFGVPPEASYPFLLAQYLNEEGIDCHIRNAGLNGDTCRGVQSRLADILADLPDWVILEIGVNDILMGVIPERIEVNLAAIVQQLKYRNIQVILAGMEMPSMGDPETEAQFAEVYRTVAAAHDLSLIPGFLNPVFTVPGRVQYDGLHPNASGYTAITRHLLPYVRQALLGRLTR